jgi:putative transposase
MGALLKLKQDVVQVRQLNNLPAVLQDDEWLSATEGQRKVASLREALVMPLASLVQNGASINNAVRLFAARVASDGVDQRTRMLMNQLGRDAVSTPTLKRWISGYIKEGKTALLPRHTGRVRQDYGWEARAVELFNIPSKPGYADVASRLREEGNPTATDSRVEYYLRAMPATLGKHSPARIGEHLHKLTHRRYQRRHLDDVLEGEIFVGDGHCIDCYVGHPNTGKPYRPELVAWLDLKSRFPVGWWLDDAESAVSTMFALSRALVVHQHVPAWVYIDRGAGYRAHMLSDECSGFYARFDIEPIGALPRNPHGKGWIERHFRTLRNKHDKFFHGGQVYCGEDMAPEINERLSAQLAAGKRVLPSLAEYRQSLTDYLAHYVTEPMAVLGGRCPKDVWAGLVPVPLVLDADAVARPRQEATVQRQEVRLHNRFYYAEALALYDKTRVLVEYDLHVDHKVWVRDLKGRLICEAELAKTIGVLPTSRLEEGRQRRLEGQIKRLENKAHEARLRSQDAITLDDQVAGLELLEAVPLLAEPAQPKAIPLPDQAKKPGVEIDILTWRDE